MAECKICGYIDEKLPENWLDWQCEECENDELSGGVGCYSPEEREICGEHASAVYDVEVVDEVDRKPSKITAVTHQQSQHLRTGSQVKAVMMNETKSCPVCGLKKRQEFDIGEENNEIWGARCPNCDFRYGVEGYKSGLSYGNSEFEQGSVSA